MQNETENKVMLSASGLAVSFFIHNHGMNSVKEFLLSFGTKKPFIQKKVLHDINLEIYKGECFGLLGRNGSGKSTLLRAMAGIIKPERGEVKVYGRIAPMLALGVGLEPELSGLENIKISSTIMGYSQQEIKDSLDTIIEFSELSQSDIDMQVKRYSAGMMARLAFSIAVANDPEILIIDEALSVGDKGFQEKCTSRIRQIRESGSTIVYVSHNMHEIKKLCTRAACLKNGRIKIVGDVEEVCEFYGSLFKKKTENVKS
ncbi:MAG: ABC transporter ATP-binding protein [Bacteroidia bacterium]|nr:ABC transporter ATP-binding protein [Bacteroidia bacterium]